jgi:hypothetical protein
MRAFPAMTASGVTPLAGTSSTTEVVGPFVPQLGRPIWLTLDFATGSFVGTVTVKRSIDGGSTKHGLTLGGAADGVYTAFVNEQVAEETEAGATYYLDIARTSGTLAYRMAQ